MAIEATVPAKDLETIIMQTVANMMTESLNGFFGKEYEDRLLALCLREVPKRLKRENESNIRSVIGCIHDDLLNAITTEKDSRISPKHVTGIDPGSVIVPLQSRMQWIFTTTTRFSLEKRGCTLKEYLLSKKISSAVCFDEEIEAQIRWQCWTAGLKGSDILSDFRKQQLDQTIAFLVAERHINAVISGAYIVIGEAYEPKPFRIVDIGSFADRAHSTRGGELPLLVWDE
ncbi:MAG: hypothetical protein WCG48_01415 [Candidatus Berkelbacteria bacterium]